MINFKSIILILGFFSFGNSIAIAEDLINPGNCGSLGCPQSEDITPTQMLKAILLDSDFVPYINRLDLLSIKHLKWEIMDPEKFEFQFEDETQFCVFVENILMPATIDGKSTITIGSKHFLLTGKLGKCPIYSKGEFN
jgi:hypothetical protein